MTEAHALADDEVGGRIGGSIRALRRRRGMTLVELAAATNLSHPFLSQVERGHSRPSLASLERICLALGISRLELIVAANDLDHEEPVSAQVVRGEDAIVDGTSGPESGAASQALLLHGQAPFHVMRFTIENPTFFDYFRHPEAEFVFVLSGWLEIDLEGDGVHVLAAGDSLYYGGGREHRWRCVGGQPCQLLMVKQPPSFVEELSAS